MSHMKLKHALFHSTHVVEWAAMSGLMADMAALQVAVEKSHDLGIGAHV